MSAYVQDNALFDASTVRDIEGGGVVCRAKVARTGVQTYTGKELGKPERGIVRVYRPENEVFGADAMRSYAHRPVTVGHPDKLVDADNYRDHVVGHVGGEVMRDGDFVSVPLLVMDSKAAQLIKNGVQFSMGYQMALDWAPGVTPEGEAYDAVQRRMQMNHVALVGAARGGSQLTVDSKTTEGDKMTNIVVVDGVPIDCANPHVAQQAVQALVDARAKNTKRIGELETQLTEARDAAQRAEAELAVAQKAVEDSALSPEDIDALVAQRTAVRDGYKKLTGKDPEDASMTIADMQKAAVVAVLGDKAPAEEGMGYAFDALLQTAITAAPAKPDPVRAAVKDGVANVFDGSSADQLDDALLAAAGVNKRKGA